MTLQEIEFALKANGVKHEDVQTLIAYCRTNGINYKKLDEMLIELGYGKVSTDDSFSWSSPSKSQYIAGDERSLVTRIR